MLNLKNEKCSKCPALCGVRKNVVNGKGSEKAKIFFVSEWPGTPEDRHGDIFSGPIAAALAPLLRKAGIELEDIYLSSVIRCIPKAPNGEGTRKPKKDEINNCADYLDQEIEHVKPTVIVPMGGVSLARVMGPRFSKITNYRGQELWSEKYNCKVMPILHPITIRRKLQYSGITISDLTRIKESSEYTELTEKETGNYKVVDTDEKLERFFEVLKRQPEFTFDLETCNLKKFDPDNHILCISFSWKVGTGYTLPLTKYIPQEEVYTEMRKRTVRKKNKETKKMEKIVTEVPVKKTRILDGYEPYWGDKQKQILDRLRALFASDQTKIAHNGKFDVSMLQLKYNMEVLNFKFDTMLAHYLLDENLTGMHGLKDLALLYTDMGDYSKPLDDWFIENKISKDKRNYAHLPTDMLYFYAGQDADCTLRCKIKFVELLKKDKLTQLFNKLILPLSHTLTEAEVIGMKIDVEYISELKQSFDQELKDIDQKIRKTVGSLDVNSTKQLRELLFDKLKLPVTKKTPTGLASTDESVLSTLEKRHPIIPLILDYRRVSKLASTYVDGIYDLLVDGFIHTEFLIHGTVTGRLSSKNPNLQNIPREDTRIKKLFIARPGYVLIDADYGQAEFRHWANYSQDQKMLNDIKAAVEGTGPDIHRLVASLALNKKVEDVTPEERSQAKTIVFGLMYGRGAHSISEALGCSLAHAQKVSSIFLSRYPKARAWLKGAIKTVQDHGQIRSVFGRLRRLPTIHSSDDTMRALAERQAMNSPIQSAASDMNCNAANRIRMRFKKEDIDGRVCLLVHDSIILEVPEEQLDYCLKVMKEEMERPIQNISVPMTADFKVGERWGELKKVEVELQAV